ncbi:hypothetical protein [Treponema primitia]|uniref:hypothetical protein n=1 Tax=Treponema primitia TaxID=88058 RepID=UPI0002555845|nr:hypothetical protein [Treponema primitia]
MKTHDSIHFVILIPHPSMGAPLRAQSRFLFAAGIHGAWSFPQAAPLARVLRPLNPDELKSLAAELRSAAIGSKFSLGKPALVPCPGFHSFFGPALDLLPPPLPYPGVLYPFPSLVLCTALAAPVDGPLLEQSRDMPPVNPVFFRAAMVANLAIKPLKGAGDYSFTWRIGKPRWLPSPRKSSPREIS